MAETKIYPKGIRLFPKHANAPTFVKGSIVLTPNELFAWLKENKQHLTEYNGQKQLKLQLLENEKGLYVTVDTWKKTAPVSPKQEPTKSDLPF